MNEEDEERIKTLAQILNVKYGIERKGKPPGQKLSAILRVVQEGVRSPEVKSLRDRMKRLTKPTLFSRFFK